MPLRSKKAIKNEILQLEDQNTGKMVDFNLYRDKDLPFMDRSKEENYIIVNNIIDGDIDDDCQTDAE